MKLTDDQLDALDLMKKGFNVFLTGPGGVGKTFVIQYYKEYCIQHNRKIAITSMTGISALLLNGVTLHSWAGIKRGNETIKSIKSKPYYLKRWTSTYALVIDEISMMSRELFEMLHDLACNLRQSQRPFGGLQVIILGDFGQLKPVDSNSLVFESLIFNNFKIVHMKTIVRQKGDAQFIKILNNIRLGILDSETQKLLESRLCSSDNIPKRPDGILATKLSATNADINTLNQEELQKLGTPMTNYPAHFFLKLEALIKVPSEVFKAKIPGQISRAPDDLILAPKAQVLLLINLDFNAGLVNGSRGIVLNCSTNFITVQFLNGEIRDILHHSWEVHDNNKIIGEKHQFPLILAWATTIHASQGSTLDFAELNLGSSIFEAGQAYVALSRLKSLDSLYISQLDYTRIKADPRVIEFYLKIENIKPV